MTGLQLNMLDYQVLMAISGIPGRLLEKSDSIFIDMAKMVV
jgi:hypothetical protein